MALMKLFMNAWAEAILVHGLCSRTRMPCVQSTTKTDKDNLIDQIIVALEYLDGLANILYYNGLIRYSGFVREVQVSKHILGMFQKISSFFSS